jgi:uncharacterized repeat protein (TIGR01451 family)
MLALSIPLAVVAMFWTAWDDPQQAASPAAASANKAPLVDVVKRCPKLRYVGREATFEITVTNRGEGAASNVVVTDAIVGGTEFVNADNAGAREGNNIVWRLGSLRAGESKTLKSTVRCSQIGTIRNTATVTYCVELADACEVEVRGIPAILLECVDSPDPIEVGGTVVYTITVTNQGSAVDTNIVVECTLPEQEEYVSAEGPTAATPSGKTIRFAPLASLAPKAAAVYKLSVRGTAVGDVRFGVQMKSDQIDSPVRETESTHIYN